MPPVQPMETDRLDTRLRPQLERLRAADLYRVRRVVDGGHGVQMRVDGRACLNFCSNDYLGLATDPRVAEAARAALARDERRRPGDRGAKKRVVARPVAEP